MPFGGGLCFWIRSLSEPSCPGVELTSEPHSKPRRRAGKMKKLKLDLEQIQVTSFSPQPANGGGRGTVEALEATVHIHCSEGCIPSGETPANSLVCDGDVFTWPTCNDYQTCAGYVCPETDAPTPTGVG